MKKLLFAAMTAVLTMNAGSADAQTKESPMGTIYVNEHVTTHLIMPETIRLWIFLPIPLPVTRSMIILCA